MYTTTLGTFTRTRTVRQSLMEMDLSSIQMEMLMDVILILIRANSITAKEKDTESLLELMEISFRVDSKMINTQV